MRLYEEIWESNQDDAPMEKKIVMNIFRELDTRGGFDSWWDDIDPDIKDNILHDCILITEKTLKNEPKEQTDFVGRKA